MLKKEHQTILSAYAPGARFLVDFSLGKSPEYAEAQFRVSDHDFSVHVSHLTSGQLQLCLNQAMYIYAFEIGALDILKDERGNFPEDLTQFHDTNAFITKEGFEFHRPIDVDSDAGIRSHLTLTKSKPREPHFHLWFDFDFERGKCTGWVHGILLNVVKK